MRKVYSLDLLQQTVTDLDTDATLFLDSRPVLLRHNAVRHVLGQVIEFVKRTGQTKMRIMQHTRETRGKDTGTPCTFRLGWVLTRSERCHAHLECETDQTCPFLRHINDRR